MMMLCVHQRLPVEELYAPPINICVRDNRQFGRRPVVGVHSVKSLQLYRRQPSPTASITDTQQTPTPTTTGPSRFLLLSLVTTLCRPSYRGPKRVHWPRRYCSTVRQFEYTYAGKPRCHCGTPPPALTLGPNGQTPTLRKQTDLPQWPPRYGLSRQFEDNMTIYWSG